MPADPNLNHPNEPDRPMPGYGEPGTMPPAASARSNPPAGSPMPPPTGSPMTPPSRAPMGAPDGPPVDATTGPPTGRHHEQRPDGSPDIAGIDSRGRVESTRSSAVWVGLIAAAIILILLLVFVGQNSQKVVIHYVGFSGHLSLAVALLLAAVLGALLMAVPGSVRILQLRRNLKKAADR